MKQKFSWKKLLLQIVYILFNIPFFLLHVNTYVIKFAGTWLPCGDTKVLVIVILWGIEIFIIKWWLEYTTEVLKK